MTVDSSMSTRTAIFVKVDPNTDDYLTESGTFSEDDSSKAHGTPQKIDPPEEKEADAFREGNVFDKTNPSTDYYHTESGIFSEDDSIKEQNTRKKIDPPEFSRLATLHKAVQNSDDDSKESRAVLKQEPSTAESTFKPVDASIAFCKPHPSAHEKSTESEEYSTGEKSGPAASEASSGSKTYTDKDEKNADSGACPQGEMTQPTNVPNTPGAVLGSPSKPFQNEDLCIDLKITESESSSDDDSTGEKKASTLDNPVRFGSAMFKKTNPNSDDEDIASEISSQSSLQQEKGWSKREKFGVYFVMAVCPIIVLSLTVGLKLGGQDSQTMDLNPTQATFAPDPPFPGDLVAPDSNSDKETTSDLGATIPNPDGAPSINLDQIISDEPSGYPSMGPTRQPSSEPTENPSAFPTEILVSYRPGNLTTQQDGLVLSEGLGVRLIAETNKTVEYHSGVLSEKAFHVLPDGAETFPDMRPENPGGWIYTSNSESPLKGKGGVGAITFDRDGNVLDYKMILEGTQMNCGGGGTPWNTWISCEEVEHHGNIYQVDPTGAREPEMLTLGSDGGRWEAFAYDIRDSSDPKFFVTEDHNKGTLRRFIPENPNWDDPWSMLHGNGTTNFLIVNMTHDGGGTFEWTDDLEAAKNNAREFYPQTEGVDVYNNELFFVCKNIRQIFTLNLDNGTYTNKTTVNGLFDGKPDQMQRILDNPKDILYFTEEGGEHAGVHARDSTGLYYTILESLGPPSETSGLAFSPDEKHMYIAYQKTGKLYDVYRLDGLPFNGKRLDVKYHAVDLGN